MDNNHLSEVNTHRQNKSNSSRRAILDRLRSKAADENLSKSDLQSSDFSLFEKKKWDHEEKLSRFVQQLSTAHAEIYNTNSENDVKDVLDKVIRNHKICQLLISERTEKYIPTNYECKGDPNNRAKLRLVKYKSSIEKDSSWQEELFNAVDASITTSLLSVAETGSIILIPDSVEPRLMSLVPPIHIVLVEKEKILNTFYEVVLKQQWEQGERPTNLVMISGPSKTADIEQTLAYGVHGPKVLIVILI